MNAIQTISSEDLQLLAGKGFSLAFRILQHREDAADAVQDSLHQLFKKKSQFDASRGTLQAWFLKIVRNRCIDLQRRSRLPVDPGAVPADAAGSPGQTAQQRELVQLVRDALGRLSAESREIVMLRDFHDLSYAEIAEVIGIPVGTVMSRLHRAREQLRQRTMGGTVGND